MNEQNVTQIMQAASAGDRNAADLLLKAVYEELRRLAAAKIHNEPAGHTLQATALVHEAYLRLIGDVKTKWDGRGHFFAAAAEAMRRILVERARRKRRLKHGGDRGRKDLDDSDWISLPEDVDLLALDEALDRLEREDEAKAKLVKLRFFTGMTLAEAAEALGISRATADRHWAYARAWLFNEIKKGDPQ